MYAVLFIFFGLFFLGNLILMIIGIGYYKKAKKLRDNLLKENHALKEYLEFINEYNSTTH